jgi:hypothetical protein
LVQIYPRPPSRRAIAPGGPEFSRIHAREPANAAPREIFTQELRSRRHAFRTRSDSAIARRRAIDEGHGIAFVFGSTDEYTRDFAPVGAPAPYDATWEWATRVVGHVPFLPDAENASVVERPRSVGS